MAREGQGRGGEGGLVYRFSFTATAFSSRLQTDDARLQRTPGTRNAMAASQQLAENGCMMEVALESSHSRQRKIIQAPPLLTRLALMAVTADESSYTLVLCYRPYRPYRPLLHIPKT